MRDRGHAAIELALGAGLLLIPMAILVLGFGPWTERRVSAEAIAAEASRAVVLGLDLRPGNTLIELESGRLGLGGDDVRVGWCGAEPGVAPTGDCRFDRGGSVSVTIQFWVPLLSTPWGGIGGLWATGSHAEPIDLYRSLG